ncbi:hypothetical protein GOP47_0018023 [Adiantum capillus-veneris]|uniref:Uncharacterized protein n=1 Tax=Adiantum capillus-veneris TaxID=13818 RepID=A0A9D4ZBF6_ADICA|nr:hypothetical protein GOP47_0018023 [Adiantum capillus-veneris]
MLCFFLHITDLSDITPRFAIEGCVLKDYGTYKLFDPKIVKFFKADLVDSHNSDTVTVVVGSSLISQFASFLSVGSFVRIEGSAIKTKNKADGGTSPFSLYLDATSIVTCICSFPIHLSFYPETKIRFFLDEAASAGLGGAKSYLGTLAFVVIKSENFEIYANSIRGELLVADGCAPKDRATVFGVLHFSNINGVLLETLCATCKSNKVHKTTEGLFCITCQKTTTSYEIPRLQVKIKPSEGPVISAQLVGLIVDEVLALGNTFQSLYSKNPLVARKILASTTRTGTFKISLAGNLTAFYPG